MIKGKKTQSPSPRYFICYSSLVFLLQVSLYTMFVSGMAFHAKISDPVIGGTYMTLLNTVSNLGGVWPSSLSLWAVDSLTWKTCTGVVGNLVCNTAQEKKVFQQHWIFDPITLHHTIWSQWVPSENCFSMHFLLYVSLHLKLINQLYAINLIINENTIDKNNTNRCNHWNQCDHFAVRQCL